MIHRFALLTPACQHLLIFPSRNCPIQRGLQGIYQPVAFFGGGGDVSFFGAQAYNAGFTRERRFIGRDRLRPEENVRPARLNIEIGRGVIRQIKRQRWCASGSPVLVVPAEQNAFLIGAGANDHFLARQIPCARAASPPMPSAPV